MDEVKVPHFQARRARRFPMRRRRSWENGKMKGDTTITPGTSQMGAPKSRALWDGRRLAAVRASPVPRPFGDLLGTRPASPASPSKIERAEH